MIKRDFKLTTIPGKPGKVQIKRQINTTRDSWLYWCKNCNTSIIDDVCELCEASGVTLTKDLKPVFPTERNFYISELADITIGEIPKNLFRYRNKIISNGKVLFTFHTQDDKLTFKIKQKLASHLVIGEEQNRCINSLIAANKSFLEKKEIEAIEFINDAAERYKSRMKFVSFSGGKDSAVTAYLVKKAIGEIPLLFSNTGIEFPETIDFVKNYSRKMNMELIEVCPAQSFFDLCEELGPPSRMMRWCCFTQKSSPINAYYSSLNREVLSFDGIRKAESNSRSKFKRLRQNTKILHQISAYPIFDWSDFEVWLYLLWRKIPINPLYKQGYNRVGCWACPNNTKFDNYLLKKTHPNLAKKWKKILLAYGEKNGRTLDWVLSGKWKQRTTKYKKFEICSVQEVCSYGNKYMFVLKNENFTEKNLEFFKVFGKQVVKQVGGQKLIQFIGPKVTIATYVNDNVMRVRFNDNASFKRSMFEIKKQLEKALNCVGCGACVGSCRFGAIEFKDHLRINEDKCQHCLECVTSKHLKQSCITLHYKSERNIVQKKVTPLLLVS